MLQRDKYIDEINQIRDSLAVMGDNCTAFSLPQPHLQRTQLCDLDDQELDPLYLERRDQLKKNCFIHDKTKSCAG